MAEKPPSGSILAPDSDAAARAIEYLAELQPSLRAAAVADNELRVIAADGEPGDWESSLGELVQAAALGDSEGSTIHVATDRGEVVVVWHLSLIVAAVVDRFVLSSLLIHDIRMIIRDLVEVT